MDTSHFGWTINEYILFLIVVIITFLIIDYGLWSRRSEKFYDITTTTLPATTTTLPATTTTVNYPRNTTTITNPNDNLFLTDAERQRWATMWARLDGNEETLPYSSSNIAINQATSDLYGSGSINNGIVPVNYNVAGSWATVDQLGNSLTDTLGGINSTLGYTVIQEQLGMFNPASSSSGTHENVYDNTQNYNTGVNAANLGGVSSASAYASASSINSGGGCASGRGLPILLQKDFAGVANIFAPNIYISDKALNDSGMPNIAYSV